MSLSPPSSHGSGGGGVTDYPVTFTHADTPAPPQWPITAVDLIGSTFTVAGDQTAWINDMLAVAGASAATVAGSTGNDNIYIVISGTFAAGSTVIGVDPGSPPLSPVADGTIQPSPLFKATVAIPANGAVEWVFSDTPTPWDSSGGFYFIAGDQNDAQAFTGLTNSGNGVQATGDQADSDTRWQWPQNTLNTPGTSPMPNVMDGNLTGYTVYPDGGTVSVLAVESVADGTQGETTIVFHIHDGAAPVAAGRIPPGSP